MAAGVQGQGELASPIANDPLKTLREEFERELAVLREPGAADRLREAFAASPEELSAAANAAVKRNQ